MHGEVRWRSLLPGAGQLNWRARLARQRALTAFAPSHLGHKAWRADEQPESGGAFARSGAQREPDVKASP